MAAGTAPINVKWAAWSAKIDADIKKVGLVVASPDLLIHLYRIELRSLLTIFVLGSLFGSAAILDGRGVGMTVRFSSSTETS